MLRHDEMRASAGEIFQTEPTSEILPSEPVEMSSLDPGPGPSGLGYPVRPTMSPARFGDSGAATEKPMEAPAPGSTEAAAAAASEGAGWFGVMVAFFSIFGLIAFSRRA